MRIFLFCRIFRHNCKKMNIKTDSRAILFARLFLYPKLNAFTENTRKNHFFRMLYRELLRFIAFRHFRCSTVKIGSQREKLSLKTLIIPRVRLAIEFGSFLFTQQFCPFSLTSGIATLTRTYVCFSRCYSVFAERLIKNGGIKCCI